MTNLSGAKEKFTNNNYDLVITNCNQDKNKTGGNILHFMRTFNHIDKVHIPILVVSAETDQTKRTAFLRSGANDFIIKPFDEDELIVRASNLIEK